MAPDRRQSDRRQGDRRQGERREEKPVKEKNTISISMFLVIIISLIIVFTIAVMIIISIYQNSLLEAGYQEPSDSFDISNLLAETFENETLDVNSNSVISINEIMAEQEALENPEDSGENIVDTEGSGNSQN